MLDTKAYVYGILKNDAAIVAALGSSSKIQYAYPNSFNALPIITYLESNNRTTDWYDDTPSAEESIITVDIWANVSTSALAKLVDAAMATALYTRDFAADIPDPDTKIFHKSLRYRRTFTADDLDSL
jgi:hypothetical protein